MILSAQNSMEPQQHQGPKNDGNHQKCYFFYQNPWSKNHHIISLGTIKRGAKKHQEPEKNGNHPNNILTKNENFKVKTNMHESTDW